MRFIEKYISALSNTRIRQLQRLLESERAKKVLRNATEIEAKVQELATENYNRNISAERDLQLTRIYDAVINELISSSQTEWMLVRAVNDIEAIYAELNSLDDLDLLLNEAMDKTILSNLEIALNDLEARIEELEVIRNGGEVTSYNKIKSVLPTVNITNSFIDVLGIDDRTGLELPPLDFFDGTLSLPIASKEVIIPTSYDVQSTSLTWDEPPESNIKNISDDTPGTYWIRDFYSADLLKTGLELKLTLDLGSVRKLNYIRIDEATQRPLILTSVVFRNQEAQTVISSTNINVDNSYAFFLEKDYPADKVELNFVVYTPSIEERADNLGTTFEISDLSFDQFRDKMTDVEREAFGAISNKSYFDTKYTRELEKKYVYRIGLDNIALELREYKDAGIYISQVDKALPSAISLDTIEDNVETVALTSESLSNSIEYKLFSLGYDLNWNLVDVTSTEMPASNQQSVVIERLELNEKDAFGQFNVGKLRFFPDVFGSAEFNVYKNVGDQLTIASDYTISIEESEVTGGFLWLDSLPIVTTAFKAPAECRIKILSPDIGAIYFVSYTPYHCTSKLNSVLTNAYLDKFESYYLDTRGSLRIDRNKVSYAIVNNSFVLATILRRNSGNVYSTPIVSKISLKVT